MRELASMRSWPVRSSVTGERVMQIRTLIVKLSATALVAFLPFGVALAEPQLHSQTRADLKEALQSEALTTMKYQAFAEHARKQGKTDLADMLEGTAKAEQDHFARIAAMAGLVREDWNNLAEAIIGEYVASTQTYARMAERADAVGDAETAKLFRQLATEESAHHLNFKTLVPKALKRD